jgi:hypothetical protein
VPYSSAATSPGALGLSHFGTRVTTNPNQTTPGFLKVQGELTCYLDIGPSNDGNSPRRSLSVR